jgi:DNA-directed RNA polymerase specialized sigma24 family protein
VIKTEGIRFVVTPPPPKHLTCDCENPHIPTEHDISEIKRKYRCGERPLCIAYDLNVIPSEAEEIIKGEKLHHVKKFCKNISKKESQEMIRLYSDGKMPKEIAILMDMEYSRVSAFIRRAHKDGRILVTHR